MVAVSSSAKVNSSALSPCLLRVEDVPLRCRLIALELWRLREPEWSWATVGWTELWTRPWRPHVFCQMHHSTVKMPNKVPIAPTTANATNPQFTTSLFPDGPEIATGEEEGPGIGAVKLGGSDKHVEQTCSESAQKFCESGYIPQEHSDTLQGPGRIFGRDNSLPDLNSRPPQQKTEKLPDNKPQVYPSPAAMVSNDWFLGYPRFDSPPPQQITVLFSRQIAQL